MEIYFQEAMRQSLVAHVYKKQPPQSLVDRSFGSELLMDDSCLTSCIKFDLCIYDLSCSTEKKSRLSVITFPFNEGSYLTRYLAKFLEWDVIV